MVTKILGGCLKVSHMWFCVSSALFPSDTVLVILLGKVDHYKQSEAWRLASGVIKRVPTETLHDVMIVHVDNY